MEERNEKKVKITGNDIEKVTLEPITNRKTKEDKELQEWEVESTGGGLGERGHQLGLSLAENCVCSTVLNGSSDRCLGLLSWTLKATNPPMQLIGLIWVLVRAIFHEPRIPIFAYPRMNNSTSRCEHKQCTLMTVQ